MSYPTDKETFDEWIDRNLAIAELGTRVVKTNMEPVRDCLERVQDAIGYTTETGTLRDNFYLWALLGV